MRAGELYEQYRIAHRERQHTRHEVRITSTEQELRRTELQCLAVHNELLGHLNELPSIELAVGDRGRQGALWREHQELDAKRQDLEQRLDKLLGIERHLRAGETPTGQELLDAWRAAEAAVAETGKAWQASLVRGRALRSRRGVGEDAGAYDAYREAIARRDALRLPVVRGIRIHHLDGRREAPSRGARAAARQSQGTTRALTSCTEPTKSACAARPCSTKWLPGSRRTCIHSRRRRQSASRRCRPLRGRLARLGGLQGRARPGAQSSKVYKGEADDRGRRCLRCLPSGWHRVSACPAAGADRAAGSRACSSRAGLREAHAELFRRLTDPRRRRRALTDSGEEGLWRGERDSRPSAGQMERELDGLLGVRAALGGLGAAAALPDDVELGRQWHAAEDAVTKAAVRMG